MNQNVNIEGRAELDIFCKRLRYARLKRGLTMAQLSKKSGIHLTNLNYFEIGRNRPSFSTIQSLADALEIPTDYLFGRDIKSTGFANEENLLLHERAFVQDMIDMFIKRRIASEKES